jgi:hypothetical protein
MTDLRRKQLHLQLRNLFQKVKQILQLRKIRKRSRKKKRK